MPDDQATLDEIEVELFDLRHAGQLVTDERLLGGAIHVLDAENSAGC